MKYIKLFESYSSQKELEELTKDILERIGSNTYDILRVDNKVVKYFEAVKLWEFNHKNFKVLGQFMQDYNNTIITITTNDFIEGYQFHGNRGAFLQDIKNRYIVILEKPYTFEKINNSDIYKGNLLEALKHYVYNDYKSTLLHELQHAYDEWRSKDIAVKQPNHYLVNIDRHDELVGKGLENLKEEELDFVSNHYKEYHNLKHEVDARFTQAIQDTTFYDLDFDLSFDQNKEVYVIKPFKDVLRSFKNNMFNFKLLKDDEKKRVIKKLAQFYELEKDFVIELNKKQKNWK